MTNPDPIKLAEELLNLYDDYLAFTDDCAFLCEAFACVARDMEVLDSHAVHGLGRNARWLKGQAAHFKTRLAEIYAHARIQADQG